eukprot:1182487-Prorocentrum_minimum.AAC.4
MLGVAPLQLSGSCAPQVHQHPRPVKGSFCCKPASKVTRTPTRSRRVSTHAVSSVDGQDSAPSVARRAAIVTAGVSCVSLLGLSDAQAETYNVQEARARGQAAREAREETETPGELIVKDSGLKYREIVAGTKGQPAVPDALCEIRYTVYR